MLDVRSVRVDPFPDLFPGFGGATPVNVAGSMLSARVTSG